MLTGMPPATSGTVSAGTRDFSRPDYVVLGMIRLGARSGYEIKQAVELSIRFFWTISQAQIYPSLERLEAAGLVEGCSEPLGKRQRRTFQITEAGESALREWLQRDEPMPFELRDVGMVKVFFADALDGDEALSLVDLTQATKRGTSGHPALDRAGRPTQRGRRQCASRPDPSNGDCLPPGHDRRLRRLRARGGRLVEAVSGWLPDRRALIPGETLRRPVGPSAIPQSRGRRRRKRTEVRSPPRG